VPECFTQRRLVKTAPNRAPKTNHSEPDLAFGQKARSGSEELWKEFWKAIWKGDWKNSRFPESEK
jgi:hypothetical protein